LAVLLLSCWGMVGVIFYWKAGMTSLGFCAGKENKTSGFLTRACFFSLVR
jgi:hypothetical protein